MCIRNCGRVVIIHQQIRTTTDLKVDIKEERKEIESARNMNRECVKIKREEKIEKKKDKCTKLLFCLLILKSVVLSS